ncbi:MAG: hypothetical protein JWQ09_5977 [Segetibacter sp.]|nr:hypothetical protein [Segetibacter sp.]
MRQFLAILAVCLVTSAVKSQNVFPTAVGSNVGIGTTNPSTNLDITTTSGNSIITLKGNEAVFMSMYRYSNNSTRPRQEFYKARGTSANPLVIQANDELGSVDFYGYDGSAFQRNAIILAQASAVIGPTISARLSYGLGTSAASTDYYFSLSQSGAVLSNGSSLNIAPLGRLHVRGTTNDNTTNAFYVENAASANLLTVRNDGNVGIGTTTPSYKLAVYGGGISVSKDLSAVFSGAIPNSAQLRINDIANPSKILAIGYSSNIDAAFLQGNNVGISYQNILINPLGGNVGIGTTTGINRRLNVKGTTGAINSEIGILDGSSSLAGTIGVESASSNDILFASTTGMRFYTASTIGTSGTPTSEVMRILTNGNIGMGTTTPNSMAKLDVNGNIFTNSKMVIGTTDMTKVGSYSLAVNGWAIFTKAVVKSSGGWPDYVFKHDYKLTALGDLEAYVKENQHLPEVPSAEDVEKNGIDLGNTQTILLKKIEELTLYIIDLQKQVNQLKVGKGL